MLTNQIKNAIVHSLLLTQVTQQYSAIKTNNIDDEYPGTAVERMNNIRERVKGLTTQQLNDQWEIVRRNILWAGGLRDLPDAYPGQGYTGHSFNDYNHCDLTAMMEQVSYNENQGQVKGMQYQNKLGSGIKIASLPELGQGGSWSTCMMGCNQNPPQDVAHLQFKSRIAFKLVWSKKAQYRQFVLVDDDGFLLNLGKPQGQLPNLSERKNNYKLVEGSKYAFEADKITLNQDL